MLCYSHGMGETQRKNIDTEILHRRLLRIFREFHDSDVANTLATTCAQTYFQILRSMSEAGTLPAGVAIGRRSCAPSKKEARFEQIRRSLLGNHSVEGDPTTLNTLISEIEAVFDSDTRPFTTDELVDQVAVFGWNKPDVIYALNKMIRTARVRREGPGWLPVPPPHST